MTEIFIDCSSCCGKWRRCDKRASFGKAAGTVKEMIISLHENKVDTITLKIKCGKSFTACEIENKE